jgi:hypothetical protein
MPTLESPDISRVKRFLSDRNIRFVSDVRANQGDGYDLSLYVSEDAIRGHGGRQVTSRRHLEQLRQAILDSLNLKVEWVILPGSRIDTIEAGLKALVEVQLPNVVSAFFLSPLDLLPFTVFVELTAIGAAEEHHQGLRGLIAKFVSNLGYPAPLVVLSNELQLPTAAAILRRLKVIAPANTEQLFQALTEAKFALPNQRWLQGRLDTLRKQALISRIPNGGYTLTEDGMRHIPQSKIRSSSDIERALALLSFH